MKPNDKVKAQKILNKIQSGCFEETDVDSILMLLRAYSYGNKIFRELADFVAHNDERDRGIVNESIEGFYLSLRFFIDYNYSGKKLDVSEPFPKYIKKLIIHQINKCNDNEIKNECNLKKDKLIKEINKSFIANDKLDTVSLKGQSLSIDLFAAIEYVLSRIIVLPAFNLEQFIDEFIKVCLKNKLEIDELKIIKYQNKIIVCILLLLHKTRFTLFEKSPAYCEISCSHHSSLKDGFISDVNFGNLTLKGFTEIYVKSKTLEICFDVIETKVPADKWCDENLFIIEKIITNNESITSRKLNFNYDLHLNSNDKISII